MLACEFTIQTRLLSLAKRKRREKIHHELVVFVHDFVDI